MPKFDSEAERWYRTYPHFPGVATGINLIQSGKARGTWLEIIHQQWVEHALIVLDDLYAAYHKVEPFIQAYIVEAIGAARIPAALPFLVEQLRSPSAYVRRWALWGIGHLDTRESRRALWEAQSIQFDDEATTTEFQNELAQQINR